MRNRTKKKHEKMGDEIEWQELRNITITRSFYQSPNSDEFNRTANKINTSKWRQMKRRNWSGRTFLSRFQDKGFKGHIFQNNVWGVPNNKQKLKFKICSKFQFNLSLSSESFEMTIKTRFGQNLKALTLYSFWRGLSKTPKKWIQCQKPDWSSFCKAFQWLSRIYSN